MTRLATERLVLRRVQPQDATDLHAVFTRPEAMRYWSTLPHSAFQETVDWVAGMHRADPAAADDFVIERNGVVIGKAGIWQMPEIGVIVHPDHWGQGIATEAMAAVIAHLFETRSDLAEITADVDPRNTPSLGLLDKLGFAVTGHGEGTFELGGELCDSTYLALTRAAWQATQRRR